MDGTTKDKIVELGQEFIQLFGYHSFKYQQIASALNIKNAAIHYYFPSKAELGVAAIQRDQAEFRQLIKSVENSSATEKAEALLSVYQDYQQNTKKLCIAGVCGSDYQDIPEIMQRATKQHLTNLITWLTSVFQEGLAAGEFRFSGRAEDLAAHWASSLIGSLQVARIIPDYFAAGHDILRSSLHES